jgi:dihydrofolate synthase / folylpolyglutamate synthase
MSNDTAILQSARSIPMVESPVSFPDQSSLLKVTSATVEITLQYQEALAFLSGLDISAMKLGLERIQAVLATLGNPQETLPMAHIAGTNGKGSVTAMLASIMHSAGYRTGRFISPHLVDVRERIALDGKTISPGDFETEIVAFRQHLETLGLDRDDWPTYFECINILAYCYFQRQKVDFTVFETGLGGRLDSTNVVSQPNLTVITNIGLDHTRHLGDTLAKIAAEKAGIIKSGVPVVLGPNMAPEARAVILAKAEAMDAPVFEAGVDHLVVDTANSSPSTGLLIRDIKTDTVYCLPLAAPYQRENLATVLAAVSCLKAQGFMISEMALQNGLKQTCWPARFQYCAANRMLIDGSHNADGFASLQEGLSLYFNARRFIWLISLRNNRPLDSLVNLLAQFPSPLAVIATKAEPDHLYYSPQTLAKAVQEKGSSQSFPVFCAETPCEALVQLQTTLQTHSAQNPLGVVTGSLYTAGGLLASLERKSLT